MKQPDLEGAINYAIKRLTNELPVEVCYHSLFHTQNEVSLAAERFAARENLNNQDLLLLRVAVYFHDLGFIEQRQNHEEIGLRIANRVLPGFDFDAEQIQVIGKLILATRLPQSPQTLPEMILADADLELLGRENFMVRNLDLRAEREAYGEVFTDLQWYQEQLDFLESHRYFTNSANTLLNEGKRLNIEAVRRMLSRLSLNIDRSSQSA